MNCSQPWQLLIARARAFGFRGKAEVGVELKADGIGLVQDLAVLIDEPDDSGALHLRHGPRRCRDRSRRDKEDVAVLALVEWPRLGRAGDDAKRLFRPAIPRLQRRRWIGRLEATRFSRRKVSHRFPPGLDRRRGRLRTHRRKRLSRLARISRARQSGAGKSEKRHRCREPQGDEPRDKSQAVANGHLSAPSQRIVGVRRPYTDGARSRCARAHTAIMRHLKRERILQ